MTDGYGTTLQPLARGGLNAQVGPDTVIRGCGLVMPAVVVRRVLASNCHADVARDIETVGTVGSGTGAAAAGTAAGVGGAAKVVS